MIVTFKEDVITLNGDSYKKEGLKKRSLLKLVKLLLVC